MSSLSDVNITFDPSNLCGWNLLAKHSDVRISNILSTNNSNQIIACISNKGDYAGGRIQRYNLIKNEWESLMELPQEIERITIKTMSYDEIKNELYVSQCKFDDNSHTQIYKIDLNTKQLQLLQSSVIKFSHHSLFIDKQLNIIDSNHHYIYHSDTNSFKLSKSNNFKGEANEACIYSSSRNTLYRFFFKESYSLRMCCILIKSHHH